MLGRSKVHVHVQQGQSIGHSEGQQKPSQSPAVRWGPRGTPQNPPWNPDKAKGDHVQNASIHPRGSISVLRAGRQMPLTLNVGRFCCSDFASRCIQLAKPRSALAPREAGSPTSILIARLCLPPGCPRWGEGRVSNIVKELRSEAARRGEGGREGRKEGVGKTTIWELYACSWTSMSLTRWPLLSLHQVSCFL